MGVSKWLYTNNTKKKVLKIVHPGGHAEIHEKPILAADIIRRNPRFCVCQPNVFQQPWALVAPHTTLMPGQKFYVVPRNTIRKLQQLSLKYHPSLVVDRQNTQSCETGGEENGLWSSCPSKLPYACTKASFRQGNKSASKDGILSNESCFICFTKRCKTKAGSEDSNKRATCSGRFGSLESKAFSRKTNKDLGGPPKRHASLDYWQPNLESIIEEINN